METQKPNEKICQSCGMPLLKDEDLGSESNGAKSSEYCRFCYQKGQFTNPNATLEEQIEHVVKISQEKTNLPETDAKELAKTLIPALKRWQKK
jgi:rRNA maturation endonuclease Nob1